MVLYKLLQFLNNKENKTFDIEETFYESVCAF